MGASPTSPTGRYRFSTRALLISAAVTVALSVIIVVTGGVVRVTGSGLGCPTWPTCTDSSLGPTPEMGIHGLIEFGNRLLAPVLSLAVVALIVVAQRQVNPSRAVVRAAWGQFWVILLNAAVGGVTVLARLSPYVVAGHFLAAMLLLAVAVYTFELIRAGIPDGTTETVVPESIRARVRMLVALTAVLVIVGATVTGTGVHAGSSSEVSRMPFDWLSVTLVHAGVAIAVFVYALRLRSRALGAGATAVANRLTLFVTLFGLQGAVGVAQAFSIAAEALIVVHLLGAALLWAGAIRIALAASGTGNRSASGPSAADTVFPVDRSNRTDTATAGLRRVRSDRTTGAEVDAL